MEEQIDNIGAAKLRKITSVYSTMELLELAVKFAEANYEKKLWSLLSRVYEDKKQFTDTLDNEDGSYFDKDKALEYINRIMSLNIPSEYKLQLYTSFNVPTEYKTDIDESISLINSVSKKRSNIAGYYIVAYGYEKETYQIILANKEILKVVATSIDAERLVGLYRHIIETENKEYITGAIRTLGEMKIKVKYNSIDSIKELTRIVFDSKEVFFTTKILFCITLNVPKECLPSGRDLYKILKICVNYEERISKEFIRKYDIDFACDDEAMCKYYIGNKKASNEKLLVSKFANHLVRIQDENVKAKLLRNAFKRGGHFRMYAGCMQDGCIKLDKLRRFHYSDEQIEWCSNLPGLKDK